MIGVNGLLKSHLDRIVMLVKNKSILFIATIIFDSISQSAISIEFSLYTNLKRTTVYVKEYKQKGKRNDILISLKISI